MCPGTYVTPHVGTYFTICLIDLVGFTRIAIHIGAKEANLISLNKICTKIYISTPNIRIAPYFEPTKRSLLYELKYILCTKLILQNKIWAKMHISAPTFFHGVLALF